MFITILGTMRLDLHRLFSNGTETESVVYWLLHAFGYNEVHKKKGSKTLSQLSYCLPPSTL